MAASTLPKPPPPSTSLHVAVIGAGAAGLVAARELRREGHSVVVYERESQVGGTWIYMAETEPDPLGLDPDRAVVHSSLYRSLRTNLPREAMGFRDYPFVARPDWSGDPRRYPGHAEVLAYLKGFAREFGIEEMVRFEREVLKVGLLEANDDSKWRVKSRNKRNGDEEDEVFGAVVVCNGHFTEPRVAEIPGIDAWPGKQIHSHNYRIPEPFKDQVVVLIGNSASGMDISRDIALVAKDVHVTIRSSKGVTLGKQPGFSNMWLHPMIESVHEDGAVIFADGTSTYADVIFHCTGYKYHFPFLETNGIVSVDDNRVGPLYKHVFPPALAPWLSFVGLPFKATPFPQFELQSKWIAGALSGRIALSSPKEMMEGVGNFYAELEAAGIPKRHTHDQFGTQFLYNDWLADQCGIPGFEEWRKEMYIASFRRMLARPETYRDEWEENDLVSRAYEDFARFTTNQIVSRF
ncbi:flavin-containing monooxygenase FMO GS-OX-like 4 isoform X2 [Punica granatum]|uniref:Flavin-containing monooxygenase n=2 Tax=Punica granatum TaxID=22663 RepID=A0A218XUA0_PUNGR|nr:flavin-containing monooxygenase FMO GS-OX-like 4 isoform X2 [Punica granatum]OWM88388.1 hypothetical protein CDL15_Pgr003800 [Punica granatum]PKI49469.1 hypothetical protein CRG98_030086 [Punica granatum]